MLSVSANPAEIADRIEAFQGHFVLPSRPRWELSRSLSRADLILKRCGSGIEDWMSALREKVGPRISAEEGPLPGLSILDHDPAKLLGLAEPWGDEHWEELEAILGGRCQIREKQKGMQPPGERLASQASYLQTRLGCLQNQMVIGISSSRE
jgi:hypothetical protein